MDFSPLGYRKSQNLDLFNPVLPDFERPHSEAANGLPNISNNLKGTA
jgi:hypothetical protein